MKIGHINFLNVLPLSYGYAHVERNFDIVRGVPRWMQRHVACPRQSNLSERNSRTSDTACLVGCNVTLPARNNRI